MRGQSQLYFRRDINGKIIVIVAKVTEDFIIRGSEEFITHFTEIVQSRCRVRKVVVNKPFFFRRSDVPQDYNGSVERDCGRQ